MLKKLKNGANFESVDISCSSQAKAVCSTVHDKASAGNSPREGENQIHRTCSQEARLDEMTVDELACYFEDYTVKIQLRISTHRLRV